jgi:hypothetical protein
MRVLLSCRLVSQLLDGSKSNWCSKTLSYARLRLWRRLLCLSQAGELRTCPANLRLLNRTVRKAYANKRRGERASPCTEVLQKHQLCLPPESAHCARASTVLAWRRVETWGEMTSLCQKIVTTRYHHHCGEILAAKMHVKILSITVPRECTQEEHYCQRASTITVSKQEDTE